MKCDIIIPIWNQVESTKECIEYLINNTSFPYSLILVDNGSDRKTKEYLETLRDRATLIRNEKNEGFVKAINQGLKS